MSTVILYVLLAIIQGQGGQAEFYGTLEECQQARELYAQHASTLALSDCTKVEVNKLLPKS